MTQTQRDTVSDIVRKILEAKFGDTRAFNQVIVKDSVDVVDDMERLRIETIFEGTGNS